MATWKLTYAELIDVLMTMRDHTAGKTDERSRFMNYCLNNVGWSRGQILQDLWVAFELNELRGGFFVEFGAADGIRYSNTYALEKTLGWTGIVAEPARVWHPAVRDNRACFVDDRCVWTKTGETLTFNQPVIASHSTIDIYSDSDRLAHTRVDGERYQVETISLNDLLTHWGAPQRIDYLSIDTEGSELDILKAFDFDRWDLRLITVEHNHTEQRQLLHDFLSSKGYVRKFDALSSVDDWYVKAG